MAVPTYIIYRDTLAGQPFDPTAPPVFFPPKGSDELFDALRANFPHVKSHSERMRAAMIEFLIQERQSVHSEATPMTTADLIDSSVDILLTASPYEQPWQSVSSASTSHFSSSPDTSKFATPNFSMSPQIPTHHLTRFPAATSTALATPSFASTGELASPLAMERMTGVFSVSASAQPKQRVRRKMTDAEKAEYRKRRIVKACDKCQKRKRKCTHHQPKMETFATKQKLHRINKQHKQQPQALTAQQNFWEMEMNHVHFDQSHIAFDPSMSGTDMQLFDSDLTLLQEPFDFEQPLAIGPVVIAAGRSQQRPTPDFDNLVDFHDSMATEATTGGRKLQTATSVNSANASPARQFGRKHNQTSDAQCNLHGRPEVGPRPNGGSGKRMLWEHLRTGQIEPTQTAHAHDADASGSYVCDGKSRFHDRTSRAEVADPHTGLHTSQSAHDLGPLIQPSAKSPFHPIRASAFAGAPSSWAGRHGSQDGRRLEVEGVLDTAHNNGPLHGSPSTAATRPSSSLSSQHLACLSAPVPGSGPLSEKASDPARNQGRPDSGTLGEGIDCVSSPAIEMFVLRRRIPKALRRMSDPNDHQPGATNGRSAPKSTLPGAAVLATGTGVVPFARPVVHPASNLDSNLRSGGVVTHVTSTEASSSASRTNHYECFPSYAQDRLSDHVTHRDHFGRSANVLIAVLAGALLLLASLLSQHPAVVNPTLLLLALASPAQTHCKHRWDWDSRLLRGSPVQRTAQDRSWRGSLFRTSPSRSESECVERGIVSGVA